MKTQIALTERRNVNDKKRAITIIPHLTWERAGNLDLILGLLVAAVVILVAAVALTFWIHPSPVKQSKPQLYIQSIEPHPFGPGWAADYGTNEGARVLNHDKPFGPGWAATYGAGHAYVLPFGPGLAATYGVPPR